MACPICGKKTFHYFGHPRKDGLCEEHGLMANEGEIELCTLCWEWKKANEKCSCQTKTQTPMTSEMPQSIIIERGLRCITCGYETTGKLFCNHCYKKYANKEILIKIKNCREIIPLDDFYEGYYECRDGHVVKSMAEREIDDYLFTHNIKHGYERPLNLTNEKGERVILHPDFCIFDTNSNPLFYIEYWGYDDNNRDYTKTKKYKIPLYQKARITLICINAKTDLRNLIASLEYKINNYKKGIINFLEE